MSTFFLSFQFASIVASVTSIAVASLPSEAGAVQSKDFVIEAFGIL